MNLKEIEKLIKIVEDSDINQLKVEEAGLKIEIIKDSVHEHVTMMPATNVYKENKPIVLPKIVEVKAELVEVKDENQVTINSPMVGTYYSSASPDSPPFVTVGSKLKKGDTVCIIEAMKLFNEIETEYSGTVIKILANNQEAVEFGQPLVIVKKDA